MKSPLLIGLCLVALAACAGAPATAQPPAPSATPQATVAATPTLAATPSATVATSASPSPSPSSTTSSVACDTVLTVADVPGWTQTYVRPLDPVLAGPGVIAGTQVGFETALGDTVGNTVACFDSAANAMAAYDRWGSSCITEGRQEVALSATIGDAVKVVYCPAGQFQGANVEQSLSLYSVLGTTAFSVTANGAPYGPTDAAVAVLVRLANAVVAHLGG